MSYELNEDDARLLIKIYKAPKKNIFYLSGILNIPRTTLGNRLNILVEMGFIRRVSGNDRRYHYHVPKKQFEEALLILNPELSLLDEIEGDNDGREDDARTDELQTNT